MRHMTRALLLFIVGLLGIAGGLPLGKALELGLRGPQRAVGPAAAQELLVRPRPGNIAVAHKPDEHVSEAQMAQCDRMLERLVEKLSS